MAMTLTRKAAPDTGRLSDLKHDPERVRRLGDIAALEQRIVDLVETNREELQHAASADAEIARLQNSVVHGRSDAQTTLQLSNAHIRSTGTRQRARDAQEQLVAMTTELEQQREDFKSFDAALRDRARGELREAYVPAVRRLAEALIAAAEANADARRIFEVAHDQFDEPWGPTERLDHWSPSAGGLVNQLWDEEFRTAFVGSPSRLARWLRECVEAGYLDKKGPEVTRATRIDPQLFEIVKFCW